MHGTRALPTEGIIHCAQAGAHEVRKGTEEAVESSSGKGSGTLITSRFSVRTPPLTRKKFMTARPPQNLPSHSQLN